MFIGHEWHSGGYIGDFGALNQFLDSEVKQVLKCILFRNEEQIRDGQNSEH